MQSSWLEVRTLQNRFYLEVLFSNLRDEDHFFSQGANVEGSPRIKFARRLLAVQGEPSP